MDIDIINIHIYIYLFIYCMYIYTPYFIIYRYFLNIVMGYIHLQFLERVTSPARISPRWTLEPSSTPRLQALVKTWGPSGHQTRQCLNPLRVVIFFNGKKSSMIIYNNLGLSWIVQLAMFDDRRAICPLIWGSSSVYRDLFAMIHPW